MSPRPLTGFRLEIRANGTLGARLHFWRDKLRTVPYDFTGYSGFYSSVKFLLLDAPELMVLSVSISDIGFDDNDPPNEIGGLLPTDGWLLFYATPDVTVAAQAAVEASTSGSIRGFIDLFGIDSEGGRVPLAFGYCDLVPSVTESFA